MSEAHIAFDDSDSDDEDSIELLIVDALFEAARAFSSTIMLLGQLPNHCVIQFIKVVGHHTKLYCQAYLWCRETETTKQAVWIVFRPATVETDQTVVWSAPCLAHFIRLVRQSTARAREILVVIQRLHGESVDELITSHLALTREQALEKRTFVSIRSLPTGTRMHVEGIRRQLHEPSGLPHLIPSLRCRVAASAGTFPLDVAIPMPTLRQMVNLQPLGWIMITHDDDGQTRISLTD